MATPGNGDASANREAQAIELMESKCTRCHTISGIDEGDTIGPPLNRDGFAKLYTKTFFRLKVKDPVAFWEDTSMRYSPKRWKPSGKQVELLVEFFFTK